MLLPAEVLLVLVPVPTAGFSAVSISERQRFTLWLVTPSPETKSAVAPDRKKEISTSSRPAPSSSRKRQK